MATVLVTRPSHQQHSFIKRCHELGLGTCSLPLLSIDALSVDTRNWQSEFENPNTAWIFTSRNAVLHAPFSNNPTGPVFAMGASTSAALKDTGRSVAVEPQVPFNSEALVEQMRIYTASKAIVVTGRGGRAYLGKQLLKLGWSVSVLECYARVPVQHSAADIDAALQQSDVLSLTSIESMDALLAQAKTNKPTNWHNKPIIVNSERARIAALEAGFTGAIYTAVPAGDDGQIEALKTWQATTL